MRVKPGQKQCEHCSLHKMDATLSMCGLLNAGLCQEKGAAQLPEMQSGCTLTTTVITPAQRFDAWENGVAAHLGVLLCLR